MRFIGCFYYVRVFVICVFVLFLIFELFMMGYCYKLLCFMKKNRLTIP